MPARTAPAGPVDIAVIGFVDERPDQMVAALIADAVASGAAGAVNDVISRLERLAALQQQGILTPEEFAAQKAKILAL